MQPITVVNETVELVRWRRKALGARRPRTIGQKVGQQSIGPNGILSGHQVTVKIACQVKAPILMIHQAVEHIAGAVGHREGIRFDKFGRTRTQLEHGSQAGAGRERLNRPGFQGFTGCGELSGGGGVIGVPDSFTNFGEMLRGTFAAIADFDKGVQETDDNGNRGEECPPGGLGGSPAVSVDGGGLIVGLDVLGLSLELLVGFGQVLFIRVQGHRRAQHTVIPHGGRHIHLRAVQSGVFLIGQQVLRQLVSLFDRRAHYAVPTQTEFQTLPIQIIVPKHMRQAPIRHPKLTAQKQGFLNLIRIASHIGQHKRGRNGKDASLRVVGTVQFDAAQPDIRHLLGHRQDVVQGVALADRLGKQLRILSEQRVEKASKGGRVSDESLVSLSLHGQADPLRSFAQGGHIFLCAAFSLTLPTASRPYTPPERNFVKD